MPHFPASLLSTMSEHELQVSENEVDGDEDNQPQDFGVVFSKVSLNRGT